MKRFLLAMTLLYISLETQSLLLLLDIFSTPLSVADLSKFERFGYATAGIGISLTLFRIALRKITALSPGIIISVILTFPLCYGLSVWALYETVERSSDWISQSAKPHALRSALSILTNPKLEQALQYYRPALPVNEKEVSAMANTFVSSFSLPDPVVQKAYMQGIRSVSLLHNYYSGGATLLDKLTLERLLSSMSMRGFEQRTSNGEAVSAIWLLDRTLFTQMLSFLSWEDAVFRGKRLGLTKTDMSPLFPLVLIDIFKKKISLSAPMMRDAYYRAHYAPILNVLRRDGHNERIWQKLQRRFTFLPNYKLVDKKQDMAEAVKFWYTQKLFSSYAGGGIVPSMPWVTDDILTTRTYQSILKHHAPHLFDKTQQPLMPLEKLLDGKYNDTLTRSIRHNLSPSMRAIWTKYRTRSITALMTDEKSWENLTNQRLNKPYLRISVVLPLLLALSGVLLLVNIISLFRAHAAIGVTAALIAGGTYLLHGSVYTGYLINSLLPISVKESAIFLF
jgi:hypothetical protein